MSDFIDETWKFGNDILTDDEIRELYKGRAIHRCVGPLAMPLADITKAKWVWDDEMEVKKLGRLLGIHVVAPTYPHLATASIMWVWEVITEKKDEVAHPVVATSSTPASDPER